MSMELIGSTLGGYKLVDEIGSGGLATVYKSFQHSLKRWVAVKVLHYRENESLLRFQQEAQAIARLRHKNIVNIYEYGEDDGLPYIVMEYIEEGTLKGYLTDKPIDGTQAVKLVITIADVLHYAHGQGIIHRDVKPSNILMAQKDWPLLADFGLAKVADTEYALTGTGVAIGTPSYISPEQTRGQKIDCRTDMYSLGIILFEMITGRLPFEYRNPNKVLLAHLTETVPPPTQLNPDCPTELEAIILKTLEKKPNNRYANMQEMMQALQNLLSSAKMLTGELAPLHGGNIIFQPPPPQDISEDEGERIFLLKQNLSINIPSKERVIIGRTHRNITADIDLAPYDAAKMGVSRQHACLIKNGDDWLIDDLNSTNGTFVNDVQVKSGQPALLKDGDTVRCSHFIFLFLASSLDNSGKTTIL